MIADLQQQLGIDASFFPQFLIFIFIFLWMKYVFFNPYLRLIQTREKSTEGLAEESSKLEEEAARLEQANADALREAYKKAAIEREAIVAESRKEGRALVERAREEAKKKIELARDAANKAEAQELSAIKAQVAEVSSLLINKLTSSKVGL